MSYTASFLVVPLNSHCQVEVYILVIRGNLRLAVLTAQKGKPEVIVV